MQVRVCPAPPRTVPHAQCLRRCPGWLVGQAWLLSDGPPQSLGGLSPPQAVPDYTQVGARWTSENLEAPGLPLSARLRLRTQPRFPDFSRPLSSRGVPRPRPGALSMVLPVARLGGNCSPCGAHLFSFPSFRDHCPSSSDTNVLKTVIPYICPLFSQLGGNLMSDTPSWRGAQGPLRLPQQPLTATGGFP